MDLHGNFPTSQSQLILNPTEEEARTAALEWLNLIANNLEPEAYGHIPHIVGMVTADGVELMEPIGVAAIPLDSKDAPQAGMVELFVGSALALLNHKMSHEVKRPIYSYFIVADGFSSTSEALMPQKKKWWQRKPKHQKVLEEEFKNGNTAVHEALTIFHITRTFVVCASSVYRCHPVDGFEWEKARSATLAQKELKDAAAHFMWGNKPWTD